MSSKLTILWLGLKFMRKYYATLGFKQEVLII